MFGSGEGMEGEKRRGVGAASFELEESLANSDFQGLHQQHAAAWSSFNQTLRLLVLLEALPWIVAGTVGAHPDYGVEIFENLLALPQLIVYALLFTGVAGFIVVLMLVYNRLTVILYARALNGFRGKYVRQIPDLAELMPVDRGVPRPLELQGFMLVVLVSAIGVNIVYLAVALSNMLDSVLCGVLLSVLAAVIVVGIYIREAGRTLVEGWEPKK